ncbi:MAG: hemagglutinin repeat-containing protein, partial [Burkholderiales bacterium]|nr:hemagglutinin repeat-containing protein [Burkholderiales bacterium]
MSPMTPASSARKAISGGALDLASGNLANTQGGVVAANGNATLATAALDNTAGSISSGCALGIHASGPLSNASGRITSSGASSVNTAGLTSNDLGRITAGITLAVDTGTGALNNVRGTLAGSGALELKAGSVDNRAGAIASTGSQTLAVSGDLDNRAGGQIASRASVNITTAQVRNSGGQINAGLDLNLSANTLDNTSGLLEAGRDASVRASSFTNTLGRVVGDRSVAVTTDSSGFGGNVTSVGDVTLNVAGDYNNTGTLSAQNGLTLNAANIGNSGVLSAGGTLAATASGNHNGATGNITNSGEISATATQLTAGGTLANSGLIDAGDGRIQANTLNNTGRVYGDRLGIQAGTLNNEGAGTIAARQRLDVAAATLSNSGGALIYSLGDIAIGGQLDVHGLAQGNSTLVTNSGSRIEAMGNLSVAADALVNANPGLRLGSVTTTTAINQMLIQPEGSTKKYNLGDLGWDPSYKDKGAYVLPSSTYPIDVFGAMPRTAAVQQNCVGVGEGQSVCTTVHTYAASDPVWALFKVAPPDYSGLTAPVLPAGQNNCMERGSAADVPSRQTGGACGTYWTQRDAYDAAVAQRQSDAEAALEVQISAFNNDVSSRLFESWIEYQVTQRTSSDPVVLASTPGQILAGGDITLSGGSKTNDSSAIVAGGALSVFGEKVANTGAQGVQTVADQGRTRSRHLDWHGGFHQNFSVEYTDWTAFSEAPVSHELTLKTFTQQEHAADPGTVRDTSETTTPTDGTKAATVQAASASTRGTGGSASIDAPNHASAASASGVSTLAAGSASTQAGPNMHAAGVPAGSTGVTPQQVGAGTDVTLVAPGALQAVSVGGAAQTHDIRVSARAADGAATGVQAVSLADGRVASSDAPGASVIDALKHGTPKATTGTASGIAPPTVQRVAAVGSGEKARDVVLTVVQRLQPPTSSLFTLHPEPGSRVLVETDPRFTQYSSFLGSDYVMQQLALDPERQLKRYGDGFYEQSLLNDQVLALTGRRYLTGYSDTQEAEFKSLMDAGVAFAKQYQLTPGVALTAEQMAKLSTDIVWLTTQSVTLADGTMQQVLVPQVYIRRAQGGDLQPSGALMAGRDVLIKSTGDIGNSGSILGDRVTLAADNDIVNRGQVRGSGVLASAGRDLTNLGGSLQADSQIMLLAGRDVVMQTSTQTSTNSQGSRTNIDRIATVQGGDVRIEAGRDLVAAGAQVNASGDLVATAGRDLVATAVEGRYELHVDTGGSVQGRSGYIAEGSTTNQVTKLVAGGDVGLVAQGKLSATGTDIQAAGDVLVKGANIEIAAAKDRQSVDVQTLTKKAYTRAATIDETLAGGTVKAGGNVTLVASGNPALAADGQPLPPTAAVASVGNITLSGAQVSADKGQVSLVAKNDITVQAVTSEHRTINESYSKSKNLLSSSTTTKASDNQLTQVEASSLSGNTVLVQAGRDAAIKGSTVVADGAVQITAGRDLTVATSAQASDSSGSASQLKSGLMGAGAGVMIGSRAQSQGHETRTVDQTGSTIGSVGGNVTLTAGRNYTQTGGSVQTPAGDISIQGQNVLI